MTCPKCRAKIGIMIHQIIHGAGVAYGFRCVMCGYWKFDHPINPRLKHTELSQNSER